jgi:hypothetical protein
VVVAASVVVGASVVVAASVVVVAILGVVVVVFTVAAVAAVVATVATLEVESPSALIFLSAPPSATIRMTTSATTPTPIAPMAILRRWRRFAVATASVVASLRGS